MSRTKKNILIRASILAPLLLCAVMFVKPMTAKAWTWYKPWTWPVLEDAYYFVKDIFVDPEEGCKPDDELMVRVMVEGDKDSKEFLSQTAIGWNYAVAKALTGKKVQVKLESNWNARTERMRTQYPSPVEGGSGKDRAWLVLHQYDMGADMRYKDIPYLGSSSKDYVDSFKDGGIYVPKGCNITIDLNGHRIWRRAEGEHIDDGEVFHVAEGATLTIVDSDPKHKWEGKPYTGGVIAGGSSNNGGGGLHIKNGATVYIEGGTFYENSSSSEGGAINIDGSKAKLFIDGTKFLNNSASDALIERNYGGAIHCDMASMEIRNSVFKSNMADNSGGAIYNELGAFTLRNCTFESNETKYEGGALYMYALNGYPRMLLEDNTFEKNKSTLSSAGAIYCSCRKGEVDIVRTKIKDNQSANKAGGIFVSGKGTMICDSEIKGNTAGNYGAGIFVDSDGNLNLAGKVNITGNELANGKKNNVCLEKGYSSVAYINNGGMLEGSKIGVHSDKDKLGKDGIMLVENISEFAAKRYFEADDPSNKLDFTGVKEETGSYVASLIGGDSFVLILLGAVSVIVLIIAIILFRVRRKGAADE